MILLFVSLSAFLFLGASPFGASPLFAQEPDPILTNNNDPTQQLLTDEEEAAADLEKLVGAENPFAERNPLPIDGWGDVAFNLTYPEAREKLTNQYKWLTVKDDSIEDIIETENTNFIRTYQTAFFDEVSLFFDKENKLYMVRLHFAQRHFSFLDLLRRLENKYGKATKTTFARIVWEGENGNIELFRNRVIRYLRKDITQGQEEAEVKLKQESPIEKKKQEVKDEVLEDL